MNLYIQEWADGTATLVNEFGQVLSVFTNLQEAETVCRAWKLETQLQNKNLSKPVSTLAAEPVQATIYTR